jgi:hypothetical protein
MICDKKEKNMLTVEQKVDIIMNYLITHDIKFAEYMGGVIKAEEETKAKNQISDEEKLDIAVETLLRELRAPYSVMGYEFMICAIKIVVNDRTKLRSLRNGLYEEIAESCDGTVHSIERGLSHLVNVIFERTPESNLVRVFGIDAPSYISRKPSVKEFIAACANIVNHRLMQ